MNLIKLISATAIISAVSLPGFAAQQIFTADDSMEQIAVVSVQGARSPDELVEKLSKRVDSIGAEKFKVIMTASTDSGERATAIAYK